MGHVIDGDEHHHKPEEHPENNRTEEDEEEDVATRLIAKDKTIPTFQTQGFLKLPDRLRRDTCQRLRAFILDDLEQAALSQDDTAEGIHHKESRFSNIRERRHRWDLKLEASALVRRAMREILERDQFLYNVLAPLCHHRRDEDDTASPANDVVLAELGALISEPGAKAQEWHADTAHTGALDAQPDCLCCFVTLQETPASMGPTELIPETHTAEFHRSAVANFPPKGCLPAYVKPQTTQSGFSTTGDALLMDCRLYHRGGANTYNADGDTDGRRVVFYFTVRSRNAPKPGGFLFTILPELEGMPLEEFLPHDDPNDEED